MARKAVARAAVNGITFIRELGGIREYRLDKNGLRILLVQDDSVPVAGCMVTYHVGSVNETIGHTGATHLLEHLMFKGSENFNKEKGGPLDYIIERQGGMVNATTWFDRTNYYEIVPAHMLPAAIAMEADRMRTARIEEADRQSEMPVVRNEFERGENLPMEALDKEMWAASFIAHPYHHPTIGWRSDIEKVSIGRLQQFYNDFYWPDNATVTLTGSFDESEVLELIKKHFGKHSKAPHAYPALYTEEPKQEGPRRVTVKRAGVNMLAISHKIPSALHADMPALLLLSSILSEDKTSRLYRAFVDTAKATEVLTACYQLKYPGLFQTFLTLSTTTTHANAEKLLLSEYAAVAAKGVSAVELSRAKRSAKVSIAERRDGPYALLSALNEDIATGDWTRFVTLQGALEKVTAADVRRVAKTYFLEDQSVTGQFVHTKN